METAELAATTALANITRVESELGSLRHSKSEIEQEYSTAKADFAAADSRSRSLQEALEQSERSADAAVDDVERLSEELQIEILKVVDLDSALSTLQNEDSERRTLLEDVQQKLIEAREAQSKTERNAAEDLASRIQQLAKVEDELSSIKAARQSLAAELAEARSKASGLDAIVKTTSLELSTTRSKVSRLENELASVRKDLSGVTSAKEQVVSQVFTLSSANEDLRSTIATLSDSHSTSSEKTTALSASLEQAEKATSSALAAGEKLRKELSGLAAELSMTESAKRQAEEKAGSIQAKLDMQSELTLALEHDLMEAKKEAERAEGELFRAREEVSILMSTANEGASKSSKVDEEIKLLRSTIDSLTSAKVAVEDEVKLLMRSLDESESGRAQMEADLAVDVEMANSLVKQRDLALSDTMRKVTKSEREVNALIASGNARDLELTNLRSSVDTLESEVAKLRGLGEAAAFRAAHVTRELERNVSDVARLTVELEHQRSETGEARRAVAEVEGSFERVQEELAAREFEIDDLKADLKASQFPPTPPKAITNGSDSSNFDRDYVDAIQQQHELELSTARARIRGLEDRIYVFEADAFKMLRANGELKSQVDSMLQVLDMERERTRRRERELDALKSGRQTPIISPSPEIPSTSYFPLSSSVTSVAPFAQEPINTTLIADESSLLATVEHTLPHPASSTDDCEHEVLVAGHAEDVPVTVLPRHAELLPFAPDVVDEATLPNLSPVPLDLVEDAKDVPLPVLPRATVPLPEATQISSAVDEIPLEEIQELGSIEPVNVSEPEPVSEDALLPSLATSPTLDSQPDFAEASPTVPEELKLESNEDPYQEDAHAHEANSPEHLHASDIQDSASAYPAVVAEAQVPHSHLHPTEFHSHSEAEPPHSHDPHSPGMFFFFLFCMLSC